MNPIIIDIGAAQGLKTKKWIEQLQKGTYYCIEPLPENFNILQENLLKSGNLLKNNININVFNLAINNIEGELTFYVSPYANSSSLLPILPKNIKKWKNPKGTKEIEFKDIKEIEVNAIRLDTFLKENNLENTIIDFIKIDTQGNDLNVVKSLGNKIHNVKEIMLEVQLTKFEYYKGQPTKKDVLKYMLSKGFIQHRKIKQSFNQEENIWFINKKLSHYLHLF